MVVYNGVYRVYNSEWYDVEGGGVSGLVECREVNGLVGKLTEIL